MYPDEPVHLHDLARTLCLEFTQNKMGGRKGGKHMSESKYSGVYFYGQSMALKIVCSNPMFT